MKTAFITGSTGQDGFYLARYLLSLGYKVHAMLRYEAQTLVNVNYAYAGNQTRIDQSSNQSDFLSNSDVNLISPIPLGFYARALDEFLSHPNFEVYYGEMTDSGSIYRLINEIKPDEIYNLAALSHVSISHDVPEYTADVNGLGVLRICEAIRALGLIGKTKLYQASTSEIFGNAPAPQTEQTVMNPLSPYASSKLFAYNIITNYREAYGLFAVNGILFNHESSLRGEEFVTRKITKSIAFILAGKIDALNVGNLNAQRDWGHAHDYVRGMHLMMQHDVAEDFILATGQSYTVRMFIEEAFLRVGICLNWEGQGVNEVGIDADSGRILVKIDKKFYRPNELHSLCGDPSKAHDILNWHPEYSFEMLVDEMVLSDLKSWGVEKYYQPLDVRTK
jgi:GDPmannose 4,6-dehydratase